MCDFDLLYDHGLSRSSDWGRRGSLGTQAGQFLLVTLILGIAFALLALLLFLLLTLLALLCLHVAALLV
ncbi:hypothetical protein D3C71_2190040 [compost metagenome]